MTWHPAYREEVLEGDYRFASTHLLPRLLDTMMAHVRTVAKLPSTRNEAAQRDILALERELVALHGQPLPEQDPDVPDAYFAVNRLLEKRLGAGPVSYLRTGLSRNDFDMTLYKLHARDALLETAGQLLELRSALLAHAGRHLDTILIAWTHHQPGQPISVAHYLSAIDNLVSRDLERLFAAYTRLNTSPLGAAALAGSSHPLDRFLTARLLAFDAPVDNTYDAVSSSDWQMDVVSVVQSVAVNMSRFTCDLLNWASQGTFRLADNLVQGSSIMPQKRNPVSLEHARTRFSRALGSAQVVLFSSHNIPYGDLNDFGPDVQGALQTQHAQLSGALRLLVACLQGGEFDLEALGRLERATDTTATELADELVRTQGLGFQEAHALVARIVAFTHSRGVALLELTPEELAGLGGPSMSREQLRDALDPRSFIRRRSGYGGPAPEVVDEHLKQAMSRLEESKTHLSGLRSNIDRASHALRVPRRETV
jgi:argininosuccinate lyase